MLREKPQVERIHEGESTDAENRGGVARRRDDGSVMESDQRGGVVRL
jgi:hypothetical protein